MGTKLDIKKFAAIDIGSNAMRLLITLVTDNGISINFKKISLVRLPVRLGQDAFTGQQITKGTESKFLSAMQVFKTIMDIHEVDDYMAVATSAMRESVNGVHITEIVRKRIGIDIQIIEGKEEAEIIFKSHFKHSSFVDCSYIYVDVGGGSTEITILKGREIVASKSFKIGSIRLLNNLVSKSKWKEMKEWVKDSTLELDHIEMIGSGGNINKIYKLMNTTTPQPVLYHDFKAFKETIGNMSVDQLMSTFSLNADRADVIVPASEIYFSVMKWAGSSILHVPMIGLSDGIIQLLHERN